jgi:hypothetical protein
MSAEHVLTVVRELPATGAGDLDQRPMAEPVPGLGILAVGATGTFGTGTHGATLLFGAVLDRRNPLGEMRFTQACLSLRRLRLATRNDIAPIAARHRDLKSWPAVPQWLSAVTAGGLFVLFAVFWFVFPFAMRRLQDGK